MRGFVVGTIVTAIAFFVLTKFLPQYTGFDMSPTRAISSASLVLSLIFGVVNGLIGPIVRTLALPLRFMTMGLIGFVDQRRPVAADGAHRQLHRLRPDRR